MSTDTLIRRHVSNSFDIRGVPGNSGVVVICTRPLHPDNGWLLYFWDSASTAADDAGAWSGGDVVGGGWATCIDPSGGVSAGRWILWNSVNAPLAMGNPDWASTGGSNFILNKPVIPAAQVNSDWAAGSGAAQILNKPTIPTAFSLGSPNSRGALTLGSAYQATDNSKAALVTVNMAATSTQTLLSSTEASQKGEVIIGSSSGAVTGATGTKVGLYENTQNNTLVVGITLNQKANGTVTFALPVGWYFGVRQTAGSTLAVTSAFDQSIS